MAERTLISPQTRVRGRISGDGDVEIHGFVDGEVSVSGDVVLETSAKVKGNLSGNRVLVRGALRGDIQAKQAIVLEEGALVWGNLMCPSIAIGEGAKIRGQVQTKEGEMPQRKQTASSPFGRSGGASGRTSPFGSRSQAAPAVSTTRPRAGFEERAAEAQPTPAEEKAKEAEKPADGGSGETKAEASTGALGVAGVAASAAAGSSDTASTEESKSESTKGQQPAHRRGNHQRHGRKKARR